MVKNDQIKKQLIAKREGITPEKTTNPKKNLSDGIICPNCGEENPSSALFCSECGKPFSEANSDNSSTDVENLGYMVCDLCYGVYELQEKESPDDFDACQCGGNLEYINNLEDLDKLKKKCTMCGFLNSYDSEKCHVCGRYFADILGYFESPFMDIEITDHSIKIYNKKRTKTGITELDHIDEYDISKITELSVIMQKKGPYLKFNYENNGIFIKISFEQSKDIGKFLKIPIKYSICPDRHCFYELNLNHDEQCPECGKQSKIVSKKVHDSTKQFKKNKKIQFDTKQREKRKKDIKRNNEIEAKRRVAELVENTEGPITNFTLKQEQFRREAKQADLLYKSYITDGISRIEKVNGRFLATQTVKLDVLIEQNNKIIRLLEKISEQQDNTLPYLVCSECGAKNLPITRNCQKCGNELKLILPSGSNP